jgi:hypothetical protein
MLHVMGGMMEHGTANRPSIEIYPEYWAQAGIWMGFCQAFPPSFQGPYLFVIYILSKEFVECWGEVEKIRDLPLDVSLT